MKHFSEQAWTDFVRGIGPSNTNREIHAHLASGCQDCSVAVGMWRKVASIAASEPSFAPPKQAVHMAKAAFATLQAPQPGPWMLAKLVFDSLAQPLTVGVRSGASDARQLMFDAEGTMVDLVLEMRPQSDTVSLVGQVVDKKGARIAPRRVLATLWTETGQPLAEASGNEFGEFQMEFAAQNRLRLSVEIEGHKQIRIPPMNLHSEVTGSAVTDESRRHY